jgi:hypothetical protein
MVRSPVLRSRPNALARADLLRPIDSDDRPHDRTVKGPPGQGLSSSTVNVLWGFFNLAIGYGLICRVGAFDLHSAEHAVALGLGILLTGVMTARTFGRFHGGHAPGAA